MNDNNTPEPVSKETQIREAITILQNLTGEDFHGYRYEVWSLLMSVFNDGCAVVKVSYKQEIDALRADRDSHQRVAMKVMEERDRLWMALRSIQRHQPIMGSTGDYRKGQLDALNAVGEKVIAALAPSFRAALTPPSKAATPAKEENL